MALEESQDWSWVARGCEAISFFVCFLYVSKADANIVSKFRGESEVDGTWDIVLVVEGSGKMIKSQGVEGQGHYCTPRVLASTVTELRHIDAQ